MQKIEKENQALTRQVQADTQVILPTPGQDTTTKPTTAKKNFNLEDMVDSSRFVNKPNESTESVRNDWFERHRNGKLIEVNFTF